MKSQILRIIKDRAIAEKQEHMLDIAIMLKKPQALPEHMDVLDAVREKLVKVAEQSDILEAIEDLKDEHIENGIF